jgi:hypothetical protein
VRQVSHALLLLLLACHSPATNRRASCRRRLTSPFFFRCLQNYFCHEKDGEFSADKIKELPSGVAAMGDPSQMMNQQV